MISRLWFLSCLLACLLVVACGGDDDETGGGANTAAPTAGLPPPAVDRSAYPLKVVVSLPILAEMAYIVGGNQVQVTTLIPPGEDPHTYVPSDDLADEVEAADLIFYNGLDFEGPTESFLEAHLPPRPFLIDIVRNVPSPSTKQPVDRPIYAKDVGDDPHLFLDPALAHIYPETISHSMIIVDGQNSAYYDARYRAYKNQITYMNTATQQALATIPDANKSALITQHNSLVWYAQRFGLAVAGTLQDDGEAGLRGKLEQLRPPSVFTETGSDAKPLTTLAGELGIPVCNIDTDNIGDPDTTYLAMMERLASTLAECLEGST